LHIIHADYDAIHDQVTCRQEFGEVTWRGNCWRVTSTPDLRGGPRAHQGEEHDGPN
jgi:hypothetical protein